MNRKKLNQKLKLNKIKISKLNSIVGGENPKTVGVTCDCFTGVPVSFPNRCQNETIEVPCGGSNGCQSDFTCTPSNWGWNCQYTLFGC